MNQLVTWIQLYSISTPNKLAIGLLAMRENEVLEKWSGTSREQMMLWLTRFPNAVAVLPAPQGKVWPEADTPRVPTKKFLKCVRTSKGVLDEDGLETLLLTLEGTGFFWYVRSGQPRSKQKFEVGGQDSGPGTMYPAPQGTYSVENFRWYGGKDNWNASGGNGLGPVFVPFEPKFSTNRSAFGLHFDSNENQAPGSSGCIVFKRLIVFKSFIQTLRDHDPKELVIDWGL